MSLTVPDTVLKATPLRSGWAAEPIDASSHHLWRELGRDRPVREFIDQDHPGGTGMGIGVLEADPARPFAAAVSAAPRG